MNRIAMITGASRGLGAALARFLAGQDYDLLLTARDAGALETFAKGLDHAGGRVAALAGDVADPDHRRRLADAVASLGGLDLLVNNAGLTKDGLVLRMSEADWDAVLDANLKGAFACAKAAIKAMLKTGGRIVNVSSVVGAMGNPGQANYVASKAGLIGLTKALAREYAGRGILVNAVAPGFIETDMTAVLPEEQQQAYRDQIPLGRMGSTAEIASAVTWLASDDTGYVTGAVIPVDGGLGMGH